MIIHFLAGILIFVCQEGQFDFFPVYHSVYIQPGLTRKNLYRRAVLSSGYLSLDEEHLHTSVTSFGLLHEIWNIFLSKLCERVLAWPNPGQAPGPSLCTYLQGPVFPEPKVKVAKPTNFLESLRKLLSDFPLSLMFSLSNFLSSNLFCFLAIKFHSPIPWLKLNPIDLLPCKSSLPSAL